MYVYFNFCKVKANNLIAVWSRSGLKLSEQGVYNICEIIDSIPKDQINRHCGGNGQNKQLAEGIVRFGEKLTEGMPAHEKFWKVVMRGWYWRYYYFEILFTGDRPHDLTTANDDLKLLRQKGRLLRFVKDLAKEMGVVIVQLDVGTELEKINTVEELLEWMNKDENTRIK
jgi:hypothetical protein